MRQFGRSEHLLQAGINIFSVGIPWLNVQYVAYTVACLSGFYLSVQNEKHVRAQNLIQIAYPFKVALHKYQCISFCIGHGFLYDSRTWIL